ncbi:MAG: DHH family phosphoesterase [Candidatus Woesearchaeota archaeon]|jgi:oligoribonuclease NrnB/cAMP/cGMP phosphodiesterase (DHH superfamily)|nr:DHH family phosphoesterase [Candidatus Woesearchaeota archaeon]
MSLKEKIEEFRNEIKKSKNPIMFYDTDTDGVTSYLQLKNKFKKITGFPMPKEYIVQEKIAKNITSTNDLIIIFDVPLLSETFIKMTNGKKILWADHHITENKKHAKKYKIN